MKAWSRHDHFGGQTTRNLTYCSTRYKFSQLICRNFLYCVFVFSERYSDDVRTALGDRRLTGENESQGISGWVGASWHDLFYWRSVNLRFYERFVHGACRRYSRAGPSHTAANMHTVVASCMYVGLLLVFRSTYLHLALRSSSPLWNNWQQVSPAHTVGCHCLFLAPADSSCL